MTSSRVRNELPSTSTSTSVVFPPERKLPAQGARRKPHADSCPASPGLQSGEDRRSRKKRLLGSFPPGTEVPGSPSASSNACSCSGAEAPSRRRPCRPPGADDSGSLFLRRLKSVARWLQESVSILASERKLQAQGARRTAHGASRTPIPAPERELLLKTQDPRPKTPTTPAALRRRGWSFAACTGTGPPRRSTGQSAAKPSAACCPGPRE